MTREERLAANEALFREVNERIKAIVDQFQTQALDIVCECVKDDCALTISLSNGEYDQLRSSGTHFAVVPGHEEPEIEVVVQRQKNYFVVEKVGVAAQVAEQLDRR
jgi:nitrate reductase alpha subunit